MKDYHSKNSIVTNDFLSLAVAFMLPALDYSVDYIFHLSSPNYFIHFTVYAWYFFNFVCESIYHFYCP
jgi:hypothetical protein